MPTTTLVEVTDNQQCNSMSGGQCRKRCEHTADVLIAVAVGGRQVSHERVDNYELRGGLCDSDLDRVQIKDRRHSLAVSDAYSGKDPHACNIGIRGIKARTDGVRGVILRREK